MKKGISRDERVVLNPTTKGERDMVGKNIERHVTITKGRKEEI